MKVQSTKPEASHSAAPKTDDEIAAGQGIPSHDFFSDLVASLAGEPQAQVDATEADEVDANTDKEPATDPDAPSIAAVLLEINTQLKTPLPVIPQATTPAISAMINQQPINPQTIKTDSPTGNEQKPLLATSQLMRDAPQEMQTVKTMALQPEQPIVNQLLSNWIKQEVAVQGRDDFLPENHAQALPVNEGDLKPQNKNPEAPTLLLSTPNVVQPAESTSVAMIKGDMGNDNQPKNKYVDALVQLGATINSHTMHYAASNLTAVEQNSLPQVDYANILNKPNPPAYEMKIELLTPLDAALSHETYSANIKIYPPELGSVIAKLKIDKNSAELTIVTENNHVRNIVEANLPQLRQHFQEANIPLEQIHFEVQTPSNTGSEGRNPADQQRATEVLLDVEKTNSVKSAKLESESSPRRLNSIIDTYA